MSIILIVLLFPKVLLLIHKYILLLALDSP